MGFKSLWRYSCAALLGNFDQPSFCLQGKNEDVIDKDCYPYAGTRTAAKQNFICPTSNQAFLEVSETFPFFLSLPETSKMKTWSFRKTVQSSRKKIWAEMSFSLKPYNLHIKKFFYSVGLKYHWSW